PVIMNDIAKNPIGTISTIATGSVGATETSAIVTPTATSHTPRPCIDGRELRFAARIAPTNEPRPAAAESTPNAPGPAWNGRVASSGTSTCHSKTNVNTIAITTSGRRRASVSHT